MNACLITALRCTDEHRMSNLTTFLKYYSNLGIKSVIVEQDSEPKCQKIIEESGFTYIFAKNGGLHNKCWAYNIGMKHTTEDVIWYCDVDFLTDTNLIMRVLENWEGKNKVVRPYNTFSYLNKEESSKIRDWEAPAYKEVAKLSKGQKLDSMPFAGASIIIERETLEFLNGWDERYAGWGCEDNAMSILFRRSSKRLNPHAFRSRIYHMWHPYSKNYRISNYRKNFRLLKNLRNSKMRKSVNPNGYGNIDKFISS